MSDASDLRDRDRIAEALQRSTGALSTEALTRMERERPWFAALPAQDRSWVGLIVQAGIKAFVDWYRSPAHAARLRAEVFGAAPQAMARAISLEQTVDLIRLSLDVVEANITAVVGEADAPAVRTSVAVYAREVAFATAEVYARQAEQRGAWDARLEALVVDSVLRSDQEDIGAVVDSRASALGWNGAGHVVVIVGGFVDRAALDDVRRVAHERGLDCLCAVQGERLVVVLGGVDTLGRPSSQVVGCFSPGPVVVGPVVESLAAAHHSAQAALSGLRAVAGWPDAPRPVQADDLLPERALDGDVVARTQLVEEVYAALTGAGPVVSETVRRFLDSGSSVEATARALYVHANTVRYRLRRAQDATALSAFDAREAYTLRVALTLGGLRTAAPAARVSADTQL